MAQRLTGTAFHGLVELPPGHNLKSVDVYVTSQCNRRCTYCFLPSDFFASGMRMSVEAFSDVVAWCLRYSVDEITFLGGEPSLHSSFADMVSLASGRGLDVRVVTNGARRFRRLMESGLIGPHNLSRVAVSLDTLNETVQDGFRGRGAWQDAMDTIRLLRHHGVLFDINVTGVRPVLDGIGALIRFADEAGCRRVNVHWPSSIGLGADLAADHIPDREEWRNWCARLRNGWRRGLTSSSKSSAGFLLRMTGSPDARWKTSPTCRYFRTGGLTAAACWLTRRPWHRWP